MKEHVYIDGIESISVVDGVARLETFVSGGADPANNWKLTQGVSTTSELTTAVRRNPFRASNGGYETGSNFQIFARS